LSVQLVSKISNLCDPDPPTSQTDRHTDRQSDGRTTCNLNTALCTSPSRGKNQVAIYLFCTRSLATVEKQRVSCPHEGGVARPSSPLPLLPSGYIYAYGRIRNPQQAYVKSTKRTLRWIAHSRSFKVILIGAGKNPERCAVVMCN